MASDCPNGRLVSGGRDIEVRCFITSARDNPEGRVLSGGRALTYDASSTWHASTLTEVSGRAGGRTLPGGSGRAGAPPPPAAAATTATTSTCLAEGR
eukprot:4574241-Pyramimonas_sp.AAC.1